MIPSILLAGHLLTAHEYTVKPGDTLWGIAGKVLGDSYKWPTLCEVNHLKNCNLIYPEEVLNTDPPVSTVSAVVGRHRSNDGDNDNDGDSRDYKPRHSSGTIRGNLGCNGLESLWIANGGHKSEAFIAAEIAMAESGGQQYAHSPTNDYGYWQINGSWGPKLATYDANGNAKAAIYISHNGTNWNAWTTYRTGAYIGRC